MKHIIEFNLPDEKEELATTMNASKYYCALWDLEQKFRNWYKYENKKNIDIEELRKTFYEILNDNDVTL